MIVYNTKDIFLKEDSEKLQTLSYKIIKIGRKWIEARESNRGYGAKIIINDVSKDWNIGETRTFDGILKFETTKYGTSVTITPVSEIDKKQFEKKKNIPKIEQWLGYVEQKANDGYVYENGISKLDSLNVSEYPEYQKRLQDAIQLAQKVKYDRQKSKDEYRKKRDSERRAEDEINKSRGKIYLNVPYAEKDYAKQYGARWDPNFKSWYVFDSIPNKLQKYAKPHQRNIPIDHFWIFRGEGYGGREYIIGSVIRNPKGSDPKYVTVVESNKEYVREDGMSFGVGDDSGYIFSALVRPATEEESSHIISVEDKAHNKKIALETLKNISDKIRKDGDMPSGNNKPYGKTIELPDNPRNIYGGGSWFVIGDNHIWYVENNGMDGDDWSRNNVETGGAGAIGWRIPHDTSIEKDITKNIEIVNGS